MDENRIFGIGYLVLNDAVMKEELNSQYPVSSQYLFIELGSFPKTQL